MNANPIRSRLTDKNVLLLDMDGTLLDLAFDNAFWQQILPAAYAARNSLAVDVASRHVARELGREEGRLAWYCLDHWTDVFDLDVVALTTQYADRIAFAPGAPQFLQQASRRGFTRILVTNAHPATLSIKHNRTGILDSVDQAYSAHEFGYPKEDRRFWEALRERSGVDYAEAVMIDDSLSVLDAASAWVEVIAIAQPSSVDTARNMQPHAAIRGVAELTPQL